MWQESPGARWSPPTPIAYALSASPRNLTDRQLQQVRDSDGMVGFNYATFYIRDDGTASPDMGWEPILRHLDHLIEHLGEDRVGLGSDFDGRVVPKLILKWTSSTAM